MASLDDALAWVGLKDSVTREAKTSLWEALGSPTLVRDIAAIPFEVWCTAIAGLKVMVLTAPLGVLERTPAAPIPVELGQAGTLRRDTRLLMGLDPNETAVGAAAVGGASRPRKRARSVSSSAAPKAKKSKKTKKARAKKALEEPKGSGKGSKGGKSNDAKMADGRFFRDSEGCQVCWAWNHKADGCSTPCGAKRAHVCEWCRAGGHRSIDCPKKPAGWAP